VSEEIGYAVLPIYVHRGYNSRTFVYVYLFLFSILRDEIYDLPVASRMPDKFLLPYAARKVI